MTLFLVLLLGLVAIAWAYESTLAGCRCGCREECGCDGAHCARCPGCSRCKQEARMACNCEYCKKKSK